MKTQKFLNECDCSFTFSAARAKNAADYLLIQTQSFITLDSMNNTLIRQGMKCVNTGI